MIDRHVLTISNRLSLSSYSCDIEEVKPQGLNLSASAFNECAWPDTSPTNLSGESDWPCGSRVQYGRKDNGRHTDVATEPTEDGNALA